MCALRTWVNILIRSAKGTSLGMSQCHGRHKADVNPDFITGQEKLIMGVLRFKMPVIIQIAGKVKAGIVLTNTYCMTSKWPGESGEIYGTAGCH